MWSGIPIQSFYSPAVPVSRLPPESSPHSTSSGLNTCGGDDMLNPLFSLCVYLVEMVISYIFFSSIFEHRYTPVPHPAVFTDESIFPASQFQVRNIIITAAGICQFFHVQSLLLIIWMRMVWKWQWLVAAPASAGCLQG